MVQDNQLLEERHRIMETLRTLLDAIQHAATEQRGSIDALVPTDTYAYDYLMIDALAREWAGVPQQDAGPQFWLVKKDTAPADTSKPFPLVEDTEAQFKALWGQS
jgi:hypothetical protein